MKLLRLSFLFLCTMYYVLGTSLVYAAPPKPFSEEGNPTDEYHLKSFFPLLRFIQPEKLIVFENEDYSRDYQDNCGETTYYTGSCASSTECLASVPQCSGDSSTFSGTCTIPEGSTSGTCSYPKKNPTIMVDPQGTDFSKDSSIPHSPDDITHFLAFPKYQNESLRYQNPCTTNPISCGAHNLVLDNCEQAARKLMVAYQAAQTKQTVKNTGEWPLGWVDWGYVTRYHDKTILEIWDRLLAPQFSNIASELVLARSAFFLSLGNNTTPPLTSDTATRRELCQIIESSSPSEAWRQALDALPLYPPSYRKDYVRTSICVYSSCSPSQDSDAGQTLYNDPSVHPAYAAAIYDYLQAYPLSISLSYLGRLAKDNPLIRYSLNSSSLATPKNLTKTLFAYKLTPFTFANFGYVYDYLNKKEVNSYGYTLQPEGLSQEEGGAFPNESLVSQAINFTYGLVDSFAPTTNHLITIPEPLGQLIHLIQEPVYESRDPLPELEDEYHKTLSNIADAKSAFLLAGKGISPADAKRRMAYFTCQDPYYSSPKETGVKDYALGTRIGCYSDTASSTTDKCDPVLFTKILESGGYNIPAKPLAKAEAVFSMYQDRLTPEQLNVYGAASAVTGVPCEVFAGIHYVEGLLDPQKSLVSGRPLGTPEPDAGNQVFKTLLDTALYAGEHLKGKVGGNIKDVKTLITALSRYNGGGNSQCQPDYGYPIPYSGTCPPDFEGEDDLYPMSWLDDGHSSMYLLYCDDNLACEPTPYEAPGALTFALMTHDFLLNQEGSQP